MKAVARYNLTFYLDRIDHSSTLYARMDRRTHLLRRRFDSRLFRYRDTGEVEPLRSTQVRCNFVSPRNPPKSARCLSIFLLRKNYLTVQEFPADSENSLCNNVPRLRNIYAWWKNGAAASGMYNGQLAKETRGFASARPCTVIRRERKVVRDPFTFIWRYLPPPSFSTAIINFDVVRLRFTLRASKGRLHCSYHCHFPDVPSALPTLRTSQASFGTPDDARTLLPFDRINLAGPSISGAAVEWGMWST